MNRGRWLLLCCCLCPFDPGPAAAGVFISDGERSRLDALRRPAPAGGQDAGPVLRARISRQRHDDGGLHIRIFDADVGSACRVDSDGTGSRRVRCR